MPVLSEINNLGDLLKHDAPNLYGREAFCSNGVVPLVAAHVWGTFKARTDGVL